MKKILLSLVAGLTLAAPVAQAQDIPATPIIDNVKLIAGATVFCASVGGSLWFYNTYHKEIKSFLKGTALVVVGFGAYALTNKLASTNALSGIVNALEKGPVIYAPMGFKLTGLSILVTAAYAGFVASKL